MRRVKRTAAVLGSLALVSSAAPAQETCPRCPQSFEEVVASPAELLAAAKATGKQGDLDRAFDYLVLLRSVHPESAESLDSWPMACEIFKGRFRIERLADPNGQWATTDKAFMFQWLSSFFVDDEFPRKRVEALLLNMPPSFYTDFVAFSRRPYGNPKAARWDYRFVEDNGRLESIEVRPKPDAAAGAPAKE